jgi:hypothetical protein
MNAAFAWEGSQLHCATKHQFIKRYKWRTVPLKEKSCRRCRLLKTGLIYPPRLVTALHRRVLPVLLLLRQTSDAV